MARKSLFPTQIAIKSNRFNHTRKISKLRHHGHKNSLKLPVTDVVAHKRVKKIYLNFIAYSEREKLLMELYLTCHLYNGYKLTEGLHYQSTVQPHIPHAE